MMRINRDYADLLFKGNQDLLDKYNKLVKEAYVIDSILKEIKKLKRGEVNPKDTKRRSKIGSYFSSEAQQIRYYIHQHKIKVDEDILEGLDEIISKGEAILRENIVLQSKPPLDVIKFKNVPVRYAHNILGKKEQRCGYGLHKLPFTDQGYSVSMAFMPPRYTQMFHNHTISEYTLVLDKRTVCLVNLSNKKRKKIVANKNEIIYLSPATIHTLHNPTNSITRNITVKSPTGILDWKPFFNSYKTKTNRSGIIKGKLRELAKGGKNEGDKITFSIKDTHYNYDLEVLELNKNFVIEDCFEKDRYFFMIEGNLLISSNSIKKYCKKNDYIVIDKDTNFKMKTKTRSRIYAVNIKEELNR
jgi:mannose-6-phosphate isomerase-like protein (cupin superfamily)